MAMQYDVKSTYLEADGLVFDGPCRVKGFVVTTNGDGVLDLSIKDGGASGTIKLQVQIPNTTGMYSIWVPGEGVRFETSAYADNVADYAVTVFYG